MSVLYFGLNPTSVLFRRKLIHSSTGQGLTGLTGASTGLVISTIKANEATATAYTASGVTIETIATLGTYVAPTSGRCRFREVDAINHPGLYEFHFADARLAATSRLYVSVLGAANLLQADWEIDCSLTRQEQQPRVNFTVAGTTLTVKDQTGATLYTKTVSSDPTAEPVVSVS